jgi:hypothetical protein
MFGLLTFFSFITAVISSDITRHFNQDNNSPRSSLTGSVRFLVFVGWIEFVVSIVFIALFLSQKGGMITSIAGHGITIFFLWLFQMAGAGAITAAMVSRYSVKDLHSRITDPVLTTARSAELWV